MNKRLKRSFLGQALAALVLFGLIHALFYPISIGFESFSLKFLLIHSGNLFALLFFGCICFVYAKLKKLDPGIIGFACGAGLGLGAFVGSWYFHIVNRPHSIIEAGVPIAFIVTLSLRFQLPFLFKSFLLWLGNIYFLLLLAGVGSHEIKNKGDFALEQAPALPLREENLLSAPDVLLISIDTLRADVVHRKDIPTPNLDRLAQKSLIANYALAPSPVTLPSHASMVTGLSPLDHGVYTNLGYIQDDGTNMPTLGEAFLSGGYRTLATAANSLLNNYTGFNRGFEILVNIEGGSQHKEDFVRIAQSGRRMVWYAAPFPDLLSQHISFALLDRQYRGFKARNQADTATAPVMSNLALHYLEELYSQRTPFFYFLHFMDPHVPYHPTSDYLNSLGGDSDLPNAFKNHTSGSLLLCKEISYALSNQLNPADTQAALRLQRTRYYEELVMVDAELGRVLDRVEASGRPTIILFTSDHGEHFGEENKMLHGDSVHSANLDVPFMLSVPDGKAGTFDVVPTLLDIPLTLLRAAGFPVKSFGAGRDLLAAPTPNEYFVAVDDRLFAIYDANGSKLTFSWESSLGPDSELQLIEGGEQVSESLLSAAQRLQGACAKRAMREFDAAELADLNALGYVFDEEGNALENH